MADFLRQRGLSLPEMAATVRFARVVDVARRNELLFLYAEDLDYARRSGAGPAGDEQDQALRAARQRALSSFSILEG